MPSNTAVFTVLDHLLPYSYTTMHFCFPTWAPDQAVERLRKGLEKTIQQMPFLSGEVYRSTEADHKHLITWSDEPVQVQLEELSIPNLDSYQQLAQTGMALHLVPHSLQPLEARTFDDRPKQTALAVCYVKLEGGLIVTISNHHQLMDGAGRQIFYEILARNTRGESFTCPIDPAEPLTRVTRFADMVGGAEDNGLNSTDIWDEGSSKATPAISSDKPTPSATPVGRKFLRFSISKLKVLSRVLSRNSETPFSTNTTCSAVLWYLMIRVRLERARQSDTKLDVSNECSTLIMATDMRKKFIAEGLLEKNTWIGNCITGCTPPPKLKLEDFTKQQIHVSTMEGNRFTIPRCLLAIADIISSSISSTTVEAFQKAFSPLVKASQVPDFDYSSLQRGRARVDFNSWTCYITNGAGFEFYQDFGPDLGRPQFLRAGIGGLNGLCVMLPRKFDGFWSDEERNTLEAMLYLREDDMAKMMASPLLKDLLLGPPL